MRIGSESLSTPRRYRQAVPLFSRRAAIECSASGRNWLWQLAWLSTASALLLAGCGGKDDPSGGLDPVAPGSLAVAVVGVPDGVAPAITVVGPGGFSRTVTGSETITSLTPGSYQIAANVVTSADGDDYLGSPATQSVQVRSGNLPSTATVSYGIGSGRLVLSLVGVPAGSGRVEITGPGGFSRSVTGSETLKKLVPGAYTVRGLPVTVDGDRFAVADSVRVVSIEAGNSGTLVTASYQMVSGRLDLAVGGVPSGVVASITVNGPNGFTATLSESEVIKGLVPGVYQLVAPSLTHAGHQYQPTLGPGADIAVAAGPVPTSASVVYQLTTGTLTVTVAGLPAGLAGAVTITGPGGYSHATPVTETITGLVPGGYTIGAGNVTSGGTTYFPSATSQAAVITASTVAVQRTVQYTVGVGSLAVTVTGLPGATAASLLVTGPNGFSQTLTGSQTLTSLALGSYTLTASPVTAGGISYQPTPTSQSKTVSINATTPATVAYAASQGRLAVTVTGLPGGANGAVTVTGSAGFNQAVTATTTLNNLTPGSYTVAAGSVSSGGQTYLPSPGSQTVTVTAGLTAAATVAYAGSLGNLTVTVSGLPGGATAAVTVTGPGGFNQAVTATTTLIGLASGTYTITAANVSSGGQVYLPTPTSQTAAVAPATTVARTVTYSGIGSLQITVSGLPGGTNASITVTGPGGYTQAVTGTVTLSALAAGSYTITAGNVVSGGSTYGPTPAVQTASVAVGGTAPTTVSYSVLSGVTLNLSIDGMYLTQAAAKYDGSTPVIAGRDAYLRVFPIANQANTATPTVRVRIYSGTTLLQTSTVTAPGSAVPTTANEASLLNSWNLLVPAALVQPNLRILADVDPGNLVAETDEADNNFPSSGTPFSVDVRTVPTWNVRFVPVLQQVNGLQGDVTGANMAQFLVDPLKMLPVAAYSADLRAVYTTTAPALESGNGDGAWGTILSELWALRGTDGSNRYYYGVVKVSYGGGVAGIGYVGSGINVSLGWDKLASASRIMAHEVGHNMGRPHSPCGGASGPDPAYPYTGGQIGVWGLDLTTLTLKAPTTNFDLMSYCNPDWVSDYVWGKVITYRQGNPNYAPPAAVAGSGLLVWGRMTGQGVILEPAFKVTAPPSALPTASSARAEGYAADGTLLFSYPLPTAESVTELVQTGAEEHFAAVLPLTAFQEQALARVRVVTPVGTVERRSAQALAGGGRTLFLRDPAATVVRPNSAQATFRWDAASYPMALVRDVASGEVLSFARGGAATLWATGRSFDITFSDGVRSIAKRLQ
ncbi:MAG: hypothetical protein FJ206_06925 [Gemmatimonadetes bacterium]|nr:hypothetical protein [Gemmatimonadota bacterium]